MYVCVYIHSRFVNIEFYNTSRFPKNKKTTDLEL